MCRQSLYLRGENAEYGYLIEATLQRLEVAEKSGFTNSEALIQVCTRIHTYTGITREVERVRLHIKGQVLTTCVCVHTHTHTHTHTHKETRHVQK